MRELGITNYTMKNRDENTQRFSGGFKITSNANNAANEDKKPLFNPVNFFRTEEKKKVEITKDVSKFKVGQKLKHPKYGEGELVDITPDGLVGDIIFKEVGKKSLMLELAPLDIIE